MSDLTPYCFDQSVDSRIVSGSEYYVQSMKGPRYNMQVEKKSYFQKNENQQSQEEDDVEEQEEEPYSPSKFGDPTKKQIVARNSIFSPQKQSSPLISKRTSIASGHTKRFTLGQEGLKDDVLAIESQILEKQHNTRKSGTRGKSEFFSGFSINIPQQVEIDGEDNRMVSLTEESSFESSSKHSRSSSQSSSSSSLPQSNNSNQMKTIKDISKYEAKSLAVKYRKISEQNGPTGLHLLKDKQRKSGPQV